MVRSTKLGIAAVFLLGSILIPPHTNWRGPIDFLCAGIAFVLGLLASRQGSNWWLIVPCMIVAGFGFVMFLAFHSY
jgi:fatty acid desaturase